MTTVAPGVAPIARFDHLIIDVRVADVKVAGRHRKDLGDLQDLAWSIRDRGLLQPIVVTEDLRLVAGERRLRAVEQLGETSIEAIVIMSIVDAVDLLRMERDENICRKDMTPEEKRDLGGALKLSNDPGHGNAKLT